MLLEKKTTFFSFASFFNWHKIAPIWVIDACWLAQVRTNALKWFDSWLCHLATRITYNQKSSHFQGLDSKVNDCYYQGAANLAIDTECKRFFMPSSWDVSRKRSMQRMIRNVLHLQLIEKPIYLVRLCNIVVCGLFFLLHKHLSEMWCLWNGLVWDVAEPLIACLHIGQQPILPTSNKIDAMADGSTHNSIIHYANVVVTYDRSHGLIRSLDIFSGFFSSSCKCILIECTMALSIRNSCEYAHAYASYTGHSNVGRSRRCKHYPLQLYGNCTVASGIQL